MWEPEVAYEVATLVDFDIAAQKPRGPSGAQTGGGNRRIIQFIFDAVDRVSPVVQAIGQGINTAARNAVAAAPVLGNAISVTARQFTGLAGAIQGASAALQGFSQKFVTAQGSLTRAGFGALFLGLNMQNLGRTAIRAGQDILRGFGAVVGTFLEMDTAARRVFTQVGATSKEALDLLEERLLEISTRVPQSFTQIADAAYEVFSTIPGAARQPQEALEAVEASARAATAGFIDMGEAARFGAQVMNAFGESDVVSVFDTMFRLLRQAPGTFKELVGAIQAVTPAASVTRQSFVDTAAVLGILARDIGNVSIAGTQLRNIFQAFSRADVQKQLKAIGVEVFTDEGRFRSIIDIIGDLGKELDGLNDAARIRALQLIFGGRTGNVPLRQLGIDVLLRNFQDIIELQKFLATGEGELDRAFQKTLGPAAALQIAFNNLKAAAFEFGGSAAGIITTFAQVVVAVARVLGNLPAPVKQFLVIATAGFGALLLILGPVALLLGSLLTTVVALAQLTSLGFIGDTFGRMGLAVLKSLGALGLLLGVLGLVILFHEQIGNVIEQVWGSGLLGKIAVITVALIALLRVFALLQVVLAPLAVALQFVFGSLLVSLIRRAAIAVGIFIVEILGLAVAQIVTAVSASLGAIVLEAVVAASTSTAALLAIGLAAIAVVALIVAAVTGGLNGIGNFIKGVFSGIAGFIGNIGSFAQKAVGGLRGLLGDPFKQGRESQERLNELLSKGAGRAKEAGTAVKGYNGQLDNLSALEKANKSAQDEAYKAALRRFRGDREGLRRAQLAVQKDGAAVQVALEREKEILEDLQGELRGLQDEWNKAKEAMQGYVDILLPGERSAENKIFAQEQLVKSLRLQILQLGENAGEGASQFLSMADALEAFNKTVDQFGLDRVLDRGLINQLRGAFTGAVSGAEGGSTLQKQLEGAERQLEILRLQTELTFDPLHRQLEQAADLTKTLTFKEALAGIKASRAEMDRLEPSIEKASAAVERQQAKVDALEKKYRALRQQARGLGFDLGGQALDRPVSPGSAGSLGGANANLAPQIADLAALGDAGQGAYNNLNKLDTNLDKMNLLGGVADDLDKNLGKIQTLFGKLQKGLDEFNLGVQGKLGKAKSIWGDFGLNLGEIWAGLNGDFLEFRQRNGDSINGWSRVTNVLLSTPKRIWNSFWDIMKSILFSGNTAIIKGLKQLWTGLKLNFKGITDSTLSFRQRFMLVWNGMKTALAGVWNVLNGIVQKGMNVVIDVINSFIGFVNATGLVKLGKMRHVGNPGPVQKGIPGYGTKFLASGGVVSHAQMAVVGEGDAPETVIPWDQKYRKRAIDLWQMTGEKLGIDGFAGGGILDRIGGVLGGVAQRAKSVLEDLPLIGDFSKIASHLKNLPKFPSGLFDKGYPVVPAAKGIAEKAFSDIKGAAVSMMKFAVGQAGALPGKVLGWAMKHGMAALTGGSGGGGSAGGLVGFARAAWTALLNRFHLPMGGYRAQGSVPGSDHPKGKAIDIMTSNRALHEAIISFGKQLAGAKYWISYSRIASAPDWRVRGYSHPSGSNPTLRHEDHVHWSFFGKGGRIRETVFGIGKSGRGYVFGESGDEMVTPISGSDAGRVPWDESQYPDATEFSTRVRFVADVKEAVISGIQESTTPTSPGERTTHLEIHNISLPNVKDGQDFSDWMSKMATQSEAI